MNAVDLGDAVLQQVADALGAVGEQLERVALLDVLREHQHRRSPGSSARICCAARSPSSVLVGGIRTSTIATSGLWARTLRSSSSASPAWPTTSMPGLLEQPHDALAQQHRVVGDDYAHGITARTTVPRPRGLVDLEPAVERRDAVGEPAQARAGVGVGAADAVVADLDLDPAVAAVDADLGARRVGVAGDVGQRLGDDEVGRPTRPRAGSRSPATSLELDRQRRPAGERLERRAAGRGR